MKRYSFMAGIAAAMMTLCLIGCSATNRDHSSSNASQNVAGNEAAGQAATPNDGNTTENKENHEVAAKATVFPLTITDATGKEFTFAEAPKRIVSTSVSETEILFALGLGDRIVGVSDFDNYPAAALEKPKMGGITKPNAEAIIAAEPDLVITGISMKDAVVQDLRSLGINLFKTEPKKVEDVLANILLYGRINDKQAEAEAIVAQMREDIRKVTDAVATIKPEDRKKVYVEFSPGWTVGRGEYIDELITMAGGMNIASDLEGWNTIDEEKIIADNPDVVIYALNVTDTKSGKSIEELIRGRNGWDKIKAIANQNLVGVDQDILARPGPRITQGLRLISEGIYPGLVKK